MSEQGPHQPLDELAQLRQENEQLRGELAYVATCLFRTQWGTETDDEYATALATHIMKQIGHHIPPPDTGDAPRYPIDAA